LKLQYDKTHSNFAFRFNFRRYVTGVVRRIEYDPNRTTRIALVDYQAETYTPPLLGSP
jgi:ribosomal protein L2